MALPYHSRVRQLLPPALFRPSIPLQTFDDQPTINNQAWVSELRSRTCRRGSVGGMGMGLKFGGSGGGPPALRSREITHRAVTPTSAATASTSRAASQTLIPVFLMCAPVTWRISVLLATFARMNCKGGVLLT